jgi:hypothetical protein
MPSNNKKERFSELKMRIASSKIPWLVKSIMKMRKKPIPPDEWIIDFSAREFFPSKGFKKKRGNSTSPFYTTLFRRFLSTLSIKTRIYTC